MRSKAFVESLTTGGIVLKEGCEPDGRDGFVAACGYPRSVVFCAVVWPREGIKTEPAQDAHAKSRIRGCT